jgi:hypothetical protein
MYKLVAASIVTAITLSVTVPVVWADTSLSGKEIEQLISGNTVVGQRWVKGVQKEYMQVEIMFKTYFNENGQLVEKGDAVGVARGSAVPAHGVWKVKKNKLCHTFSDSLRNKGKQICFKVFQKEDGTYAIAKGKDGKVIGTWKEILPGNPHNLE